MVAAPEFLFTGREVYTGGWDQGRVPEMGRDNGEWTE
ncbi:hypothetical protein A2U01_0114060, partial [Trifolium medium]|nr:hypothetical protein [Trifolium medium]